MNIALSFLFHVNNTQHHFHLSIAVKKQLHLAEALSRLKRILASAVNEMSSGGGPSAQQSKYQRRTASVATGISVKKR